MSSLAHPSVERSNSWSAVLSCQHCVSVLLSCGSRELATSCLCAKSDQHNRQTKMVCWVRAQSEYVCVLINHSWQCLGWSESCLGAIWELARSLLEGVLDASRSSKIDVGRRWETSECVKRLQEVRFQNCWREFWPRSKPPSNTKRIWSEFSFFNEWIPL